MSDEADLVAGLASRIHAAGSRKAVLYVAGGGTEVFPMLLARGGGSASLLAGRILYEPADFCQALGHDPGRLVSSRAAGGLAMAAFHYALAVRGELAEAQVFGLGATSKLTRGLGEREGRSHEVQAALQDSRRSARVSASLPGAADRFWQERITSLILLNLIAEGKGIDGSIPLCHEGLALPPEALLTRSAGAEDCGGPAVEDLLLGRRGWVALDLSSGTPRPEPASPGLLLPGSFRPLHEGHLAMARAATELIGRPCDFEISLTHPEKPALDYLAIQSRLAYFAGLGQRVVLTTAPTYLEKARLFPACTFVVGHDTALRVVDPRFYGGVLARDAALDELEGLGARFLVFGRIDPSGTFRDLAPDQFDGVVSGFLTRVATPVPGDQFRLDISSTEIRRRWDADED